MAIKVTVRMGGHAGAATKDFTSQVPTDFEYDPPVSANAFGQGHGTQGSFTIIDDANAIRDDGVAQINAHNQVTISEDASGTEHWTTRGRIARKEADRGDHPWADSRTWNVVVEDPNTEIKGMALTEEWVRGAETGTERLLALGSAFFQGSPRLTTNVTFDRTHLVIPHPIAGEAAMEAKTYPAGTDMDEIIRDCAETEGQDWGIVLHHTGGSHHCFQYIEEDDWNAYPCTLSISDDPADINNTTVFAPIWDQGAAIIEEGQDVWTGIVSRWGVDDTSYVVETDSALVEKFDYWVAPYNDTRAQTESAAAARAPFLLDGNENEHVTHQVTIRVPASSVHLVEAGMSISIKTAASRHTETLGTAATRRIASVKKEPISPNVGAVEGQYLVHMQLARPLKIARTRQGPLTPKPAAPGGTSDLHADGLITTLNSNDVLALGTAITGESGRSLYVLAYVSAFSGTPSISSITYASDGDHSGTGANKHDFTQVGSTIACNSSSPGFAELWRLNDPPAGNAAASIKCSVTGQFVFSAFYADTRPVRDFAANGSSSSGTTSSVTVESASGDRVLDMSGWNENNSTVETITPGAGQTLLANDTVDRSFGQPDGSAGTSHQVASGATTTHTWTFSSHPWYALAFSLTGSAGDTPEPIDDDGGTGVSDDYARKDHVHAHGDQSDHTSSTHHHAGSVEVTPFSTIAATNVQDALEEIVSEATGGTDDQTAAEVPFTPAGTIAATDTQAAVEEVATDAAADLAAHTGDATDAHDASAVSYDNTTSGMTATDVQAAIDELEAGGGGGGSDEKAKVSANDTTADYLASKLVAGTDITITENNDGGNETLTIASTASGGGSDSEGWTVLTQALDQDANNTSTFQLSTDLAFTPDDGSVYEIDFTLLLSAGPGNMNWSFGIPSITVGRKAHGWVNRVTSTGATGQLVSPGNTGGYWPNSGTGETSAFGLTLDDVHAMFGRLVLSTFGVVGAADVVFRFRNATTGGGEIARLHAGSVMRYRKMA